MMRTLCLLAAILMSTTAAGADTDWSKVVQVLGRKGAAQAGGIYRYGIPRSDLKVTLDGVAIKPPSSTSPALQTRSTQRSQRRAGARTSSDSFRRRISDPSW